MAKVQKITKVTSIEIEVGGHKLSLTPDEARELRDELASVLGRRCCHHYYPWTYVPTTTWPTTHTITSGTSTTSSGGTYIVGETIKA